MEKILVFAPLFAAAIVGINVRAISTSAAQYLTAGATILSAILSTIVFYHVVLQGETRVIEIASWINSGQFSASWTLHIDALTAVMLIVVTYVSSLVHVYSVGYMGHDPHPQRFMAYLSLFTFFMLMLVTSNNFLQLFLGWEGVGLCSYFLIGFWFRKPAANAAAIKAFLVNRVGDFAFALGIMAIFFMFDSIMFEDVFNAAPALAERSIEFLGMEFHALTLICVLLFIGAMGKSAQLGLHTWLPDAMEGPTPVSALIHAATMVTAGIFLVARCSPLFEQSEFALQMVTIVGAATCFFAATVAVTQNDIKKVIAYSTCSQLGYMFFACGVSAYSAGIFHLFTHGFFKALLFLGAGSVIHAMSNEQDMRNMGGIWRKIPFTYAMMLIGTVAIVGLPPFSGFYSKDMIIESAYAAGHDGNNVAMMAFWLGVVSAILTAVYSWRLIFMTFHGYFQGSEKTYENIHESPKSMTVPLLLLAIGAVLAGGVFYHIGIVDADLKFWNKSIVMADGFNVLEAAHHSPLWVKLAPLVASLVGLGLAFMFYIKRPELPERVAAKFPAIYKFLLNKWYFDELYDTIFVEPAKKLGSFLWKQGDIGIIDRYGPNGFARACQKVAKNVSEVQTGYVYHYAFAMILGMLGVVSWVLYNNINAVGG